MIENCSDGTFSVLYFSIKALFSLASCVNFKHKVKGTYSLSELAGHKENSTINQDYPTRSDYS